MINNKKESIIVVDNIDDSFNTIHQCDYVNFLKTDDIKLNQDQSDIIKKILLHDKRFIYFLQIIKNNKLIDNTNIYYLITDVADVELLNDPDTILKLDPNIIYICKENETIDKNIWFDNYIKDILKIIDPLDLEIIGMFDEMKELFSGKIILNCGAILVCHDLMIKLLNDFVSLTIKLYSKYSFTRPLDMLFFNYVIYKYYSECLYLGNDFNTKFGHYLREKGKVIKHK